MSYHVRILKTERGEKVPLGRQEVEAAVSHVPNLAVTSSAPESIDIEHSASNGARSLLIWQNGEIWTRNPETETLEAMLALADQLRARVRGDELETYRTPDDTYLHPDDQLAVEVARKETERIVRGTKRKQWVLNLVIFGTFILLALLVAYFSRR